MRPTPTRVKPEAPYSFSPSGVALRVTCSTPCSAAVAPRSGSDGIPVREPGSFSRLLGVRAHVLGLLRLAARLYGRAVTQHRWGNVVSSIASTVLAGAVLAGLSACSQASAGTPGAVLSAPTAAAAIATATVATRPASAPSPVPAASLTPAPPTPALTTTPSPSPSPSRVMAATGRARVAPIITFARRGGAAGVLDVAGMVPGRVERGGTCTVRLSQSEHVRTVSAAGVAASTYTGCPRVHVTGLTPGVWQVRLGYSSPASVGVSDQRSVRVE